MKCSVRTILISLTMLGVAGVAGVLVLAGRDRMNPYVRPCDLSVPAAEIPEFREAPLAFARPFDPAATLPVMASALIDIDDDGTDELFLGGAKGESDSLFRYQGGAFADIASEVNLGTTDKLNSLGAVSYDLDGDGRADLLVARDDGLWFCKHTPAGFVSSKLDIPFDPRAVPVSITVGDYDNDGLPDLFVSCYLKPEFMEGQTIFNKPGYGVQSLLLHNTGAPGAGDVRFEDATARAGLTYVHNTFVGVFVDLDDDGRLDLAVAYDTGEPRIYHNLDGKRFEATPTPMTGRFGYPMGIGVGDYDNDGRPDLFFSNTGSTVPTFLAKGDLRKDQELVTTWLLFHNDGGMRFTDAAGPMKLADFEFSWGAIFEDFNLDGRQDLAVAENYIAFPVHKLFKLPCRFLLQRPSGVFAAVEEQAGVVNRDYAITPLTADFNQDGYPDLAYANLGGNSRAFLSRGLGGAAPANHWVKVRLAESGINAGARVQVSTASGRTLTDFYVVGEGLGSDQSNTLVFGMGQHDRPTSIRVTYPGGREESIDSPQLHRAYPVGHLVEVTPPQ